MKRFTAAVLVITLSTAPAFAQMKGHGRGDQKDATSDNTKKNKVDDAAYQRALKSIPDSKVKVDPWNSMR